MLLNRNFNFSFLCNPQPPPYQPAAAF